MRTNTSNSERQLVWMFEFGLEGQNGRKIERTRAEELLTVIIEWAEQNDLQIGGGYREPQKEEI